MSNKIKVIPCSGMGKVFGLVSREAAIKVVKELSPEQSETVCLAHIVTGDQEAKEKISGLNCITLDGCPKMCAAKNVSKAGGIVREEYRVVDAFKKHRGAKPGTATSLTDDGWQIVDEIAAELTVKVQKMYKEDI